MPSRATSPTLNDAFVEEMARLLRENKRIHRRLPFGGMLHIDRQLPFLCLYRIPVGAEDEGTDWLVRGEASYLVCSAHKGLRRPLNTLLEAILKVLQEAFGASLILEVWSGEHHPIDESEESADEFQPIHIHLIGRLFGGRFFEGIMPWVRLPSPAPFLFFTNPMRI